jgi:hypothetical protein
LSKSDPTPNQQIQIQSEIDDEDEFWKALSTEDVEKIDSSGSQPKNTGDSENLSPKLSPSSSSSSTPTIRTGICSSSEVTAPPKDTIQPRKITHKSPLKSQFRSSAVKTSKEVFTLP